MTIRPEDLGKCVRLKYGSGEVYTEGTVLAHSLVPSILIETESGERIWWRHDMADVIEGTE
jgi:hypothetical protein